MRPHLPVFSLEVFITNNLEFLTGKLTPEEPGYDQVLDVLATRLLHIEELTRSQKRSNIGLMPSGNNSESNTV